MSAYSAFIREQATVLRGQYGSLLGGACSYPLDVADLAEEMCQTTPFVDTTLPPGIEGILDARRKTIRLNASLSEWRRRFVIAHEVGHLLLQGLGAGVMADDAQTLNERAGSGSDSDRTNVAVYSRRERHEQDANLFALELLIPAALLWQRVQEPAWTIEGLATHFGVSEDALRSQLVNVCCMEPPSEVPAREAAALPLDDEQRRAVEAALPTLVVAGPGTGKTRTLVGKYLWAIEQGLHPSQILALTFSNKAAEEMQGRILAALHATGTSEAQGVEVTTFHAWGLNFLKRYGHLVGLPPSFRLLNTGDLYVLLYKHLDLLPLQAFKSLHQPGFHLRTLLRSVSRLKDELCEPEAYQGIAEAAALALLAEAEADFGGKTTKSAQKELDKAQRDADKLREVAAFYTAYEALLRAEGLVDYGDLIRYPVTLLGHRSVAEQLHQQVRLILVDEFQDINYASGELVRRLDGGRDRVWIVGDPWQSIYRFRGASPVNLASFAQHYPRATQLSLSKNYRSRQPILDASRALMSDDPLSATRPPQQAQREDGQEGATVVEEWVIQESSEGSAIAHDILRRVQPEFLPACVAWPPDQPRPAPQARFGDHAVLCRKHDHAQSIARSLEAHGIPVEWVGSVLDYPEIKDLLAVCALAHSEHGPSFLRAVTLPEHPLDETDLRRLVRAAHRHKLSLPRAARASDVVQQLSTSGQASLDSLHQIAASLAGEMDAWQLLTTYLFRFSQGTRYRIRAAGEGDGDAQQALKRLGQLLSVALGFVRQSHAESKDITAFLDYLHLLQEAGEAPTSRPSASGDAVQVITAHAAKGLEFPVVYVPFLVDGQFPVNRGTSLPIAQAALHPLSSADEAGQEERFLLYVAMTRARDRLVLSRLSGAETRALQLAPRRPRGRDRPLAAPRPRAGTRLPANARSGATPPGSDRAEPPARLQPGQLCRVPAPLPLPVRLSPVRRCVALPSHASGHSPAHPSARRPRAGGYPTAHSGSAARACLAAGRPGGA